MHARLSGRDLPGLTSHLPAHACMCLLIWEAVERQSAGYSPFEPDGDLSLLPPTQVCLLMHAMRCERDYPP